MTGFEPLQSNHEVAPTPGREELAVRIANTILDPDVRLLTLTGPGGIGKSHLALEIASILRDERATRVSVVPLDAFRDPDHAMRAIDLILAERHGASTASAPPGIGEGEHVLVLDTLELHPELGPLLGARLDAHPHLTVLATSRHPLHIQREHVWTVPPLGFPGDARVETLDDLVAFDGCRLFLTVAGMVTPETAILDDHATVIAALSSRLGGSPLAIQLAARQLRYLAIGELAARIGEPLDLVDDGVIDFPERHRSLRTSIAWSHDLLSAEERSGFHLLGVFPGSFPMGAAIDLVAGGSGCARTACERSQALRIVTSLLDQHLVQRENASDGTASRLRLDIAARAFARERLSEAGACASATARLASWCIAHSEQATAWDGSSRSGGEDTIAAEAETIGDVRAWVIDTGDWGSGFRLVDALYEFWLIRGCTREEREWLWQLLEMAPATLPPDQAILRARLMHTLGLLSHTSAEFDAAERAYLAALALRRDLADRAGELDTLHNLAVLALSRGDLALAEERFLEPIALARAAGDRQSLASSLCYLATVRNGSGIHDGAWDALHEAGSILRLGAHQRDLAFHAICLGDVLWNRGLKGEAVEQWETAGRKYAALDAPHSMASVSLRLAMSAREARQLDLAATHTLDTFAFLARQPDARLLAESMIEHAALSLLAGRQRWAATAIAASDAVIEGLGAIHMPRVERERAKTLRAIRHTLGDHATDAAMLVGQGMTTDDVLAGVNRCAREIVDALPLPSAMEGDTAPIPDLTPREHDVVRLLAAGHTNREIGDALCLGHRTIATHVSNLLAKLGVATRAAAAGEAVRLGLVRAEQDVLAES